MRNLKSLDNSQLLLLRAEVDAEMHNRALNFNVGDIGETLAIAHFKNTSGLPNLQLASRGSKNIDAISRDGKRYSIKTVQRAKKTGTIYPGLEANEQLFEYLLIVLINDQYKLQNIYRLTWQTFVKLRAWDKRMSAWYVPVSAVRLRQAEKIV